MHLPAGYREQSPSPLAARHVETAWSFCADAAGTGLVLPDGRCDIIVYTPPGAAAVDLVLCGPATRAFSLSFEAGARWIGLRLRPERGALIWGEELVRATDRVLRGADAMAYLPALAPLCRLGVTGAEIETALDALPPRRADPGLTRSLEATHLSGGRLDVDRLARHVGLTTRHLSRLWRAHVGLSPKTYAQIIRFHRALRLLRDELGGGLTPIAAAYEAGYADQAHMARAFRRFGGFAPSGIPEGLNLPGMPGMPG